MTPPLPRRKQMLVIKLFFQGLSYQQIQRHAKVGEGSIQAIVDRLRTGQYTEFADVTEIVDTLREVSLFVRKELDGDLERCHIGSAAYAGLRRLGVEPSRVKDIVALFEELTQEGMQAKTFVETSLFCWHLKETLGGDLAELPKRLDTLVEEVRARQRERDGLQSETQSLKAAVESLRTELRLLEDIKGLQKVRETEASLAAETEARTKATLEKSGRTLEDIERFRVLEGTSEAKGIPLGSNLFDTLLELIVALGPEGVRDGQRIKELLAEEGLAPAEGAALLVGLKERGFTLRQATAIVQSLGAGGRFSDRLRHLTNLLDRYDSLDVAVAAINERLGGLQNEERTKIAALSELHRGIRKSKEELNGVQLDLKKAIAERDGTREETRRILAERQVMLDSLDVEQRRAEDTAQGATEAAAEALATQSSAEGVAAALAKRREEAATLRGLITVAGRNLGKLMERIREASVKLEVAAYMTALIQGKKEGLRVFTEAAKAGLLEQWEARDPHLSDDAVGWLREELIKAQGGALVSAEECEKKCNAKDREVEADRAVSKRLEDAFRTERERKDARIKELEGTLAKELASREPDLRERDEAMKKAEAKAQGAEAGRRSLAEELRVIQGVLPKVQGKVFSSPAEFQAAVVRATEAEVRSRALSMHREWRRNVFADGRIAVVREHARTIRCPCGRDFEVRITAQRIAEVVSGFRPGGLFPILGRPGIGYELCPGCGKTLELTLDDLLG